MKRELKNTLAVSLGVAVAAFNASALELDLTSAGVNLQSLVGDFGGTAYFGNFNGHPTGTGVYQPFLDLQEKDNGIHGPNIEGAYNTDGATAMYLDQARSHWNHLVQIKDLQEVLGPGGLNYYVFELDANEPDGNKRFLSVDNIRIYTSSANNTASVGSNEALLDNLGTLRWAMNDPLKTGNQYDVANWIKLDSSQSDTYGKANGGSGWSDMLAYIPVSAFAGVSQEDYLWFYNLNGVHWDADDGSAAQSGYEEWRYVAGPQSVPDGGATLALLGLAFSAMAAFGRWFKI